ncbi:hypothetical protein C4D60_Mb07t18990 [Musa balbisiana]|uniref:Uncharacterized protein n=1 Tax=Musa balbisiana TaxID=52838 RepID=A0A4S8JGL8_MUSBA|nr:hypothetical protein C4D60_Mb07t18990 [Musa balbisiana]
MERREEEEYEEQQQEARAGAGGKMTRRPFRLRAPPTPYDRPPAVGGKERREGDGWVSKILVRPASTIIPSLFSPSPSPSAASNQEYPPLSESFPGTRQDDADRVSSPDVREQSNCLMKLLLSRTRDLSHDDRPAAGFVTKADGTLNLKAPRKSAQSVVLLEQRITPKPLEASEMRVAHDVGSSPIEIAKAYMEALANESNHNSHDGRLELEKATFDNCASASDMSYSSDVKLPICWPGAFVESNYRYRTPQTPRTKVPEKYNESTPSKEFGTSNLANFCLMSSATSNDKNLSSPLGMISEKDSLASSLNFQTAEGSKYNIGPSSVHPKSSQMARKILEHLDRTVPSPKEKMVQLKPEKTGTKDFLNSACLAMDGREKRPDVSIIDDDKPNSLSMDTAAAEEATTRLIMDNNHDKRPSITLNTTNQSILRAMEKTSEGFVFTFPVSTPINAPSQSPPTPTMTSSPAVCRMLSNTEDTIPSFTFSSPRADNGLVFSFGSISSLTSTDTTTLQFKFGSEKQRNLSFSSTSKDTFGLWVGS